MTSAPKLNSLSSAAGLMLVLGVMTASAEEVSEHIMTAVSGTQISGYVSTSASWMAGGPQHPARPNLWSLHHALSQPVRAPQLSFDPLADVPFQKPAGPDFSLRSPHYSGGVTITVLALGDESQDRPQMADSFSFELAAVPEPATTALLGFGAFACWYRARRQRTAAR